MKTITNCFDWFVCLLLLFSECNHSFIQWLRTKWQMVIIIIVCWPHHKYILLSLLFLLHMNVGKKIQWTHLAWYFSNQPDRSSSSSLIYYCLHSLFLVQKSLNFITNHSGSSSKKILDQYLRQTPCSKELVTNYFIHLSFIFIFSKFFFWFRI